MGVLRSCWDNFIRLQIWSLALHASTDKFSSSLSTVATKGKTLGGLLVKDKAFACSDVHHEAKS